MAPDPRAPAHTETFSERGFYLAEFRGRTLGIAGVAADLRPQAPLDAVLHELAENGTKVVLISDEREALEGFVEGAAHDAWHERLEGEVWRAFAKAPRVGVLARGGSGFAHLCTRTALRLGLSKLVWIDAGGGLFEADGSRDTFIDLTALHGLIAAEALPPASPRGILLAEVARALEAGLPAVNLCTLEGLSEELFTYAGSGTLFTRERYVEVRRLGLDDFDAANDLIARGVEEGYLTQRSAEEVDRVLANGFGAFVEARHLAGIGALLDHPRERAGEIASLYTLTRFVGEGVGGHLIRFIVDQARTRDRDYVFACTTSDRVAGFFERHGFRRVEHEEVPEEKWQRYDPARRKRVRCLRTDLG